MLKPSHREKSFTAKRVFTDREGDREVFGAACDRTETRELYQVLMWYGVGGQGKSALLREFGRMLASRNEAAAEARSDRRLALAKVDFDDERLKRIDSALYSLRLQLAQSCGFAFHTFDAAFVSYYKKTRPGIDVAAEFPELFKGEKEGLSDLLDVLDDHLSLVTDLASVALPGANLIYKWGARLTGRLKTWWSTRGNQVLAGIEKLTPEEILQKLPSYLGIDLCDGIAAKPSIRPVILLDTYEALWRERGQKDALTDRRTDAWVRLLVQDAPGTLFVIAGRDKLRWGEIDPAWNEVIDARLLGGLSAEDADRFLMAVPITEDDIRARIVGSSEGLPFYLDLQVSQYEAIRERGEAPVVAQFGGTPSDILSRFLEHLNDTEQSVLRLASYFNTITRPAMTELADAFPQRAVNFSFDRMIARSAFTPVADDAYTIHALMQEELQRREREENEALFKKIHRHLFEYYNTWLLALTEEQQKNMDVIKDAHRRFEMAFNHQLIASQDEAVSWLLKYQHWIAGHDAWELVEKLHRRAVAAMESSRHTNDPELLIALNNLAAAIEKQNRSEEAQPVLERLIKVAGGQAAPDADLLATAHFNLAQLLRDDKSYAEAEEHYSRAADLWSADEANRHGRLCACLAGLGECLYLQARYADAVPFFRDAALHALKSKNSGDFTLALHLLAEGYQAVGEYEKAIPLFQLSLADYSILDHHGNPNEQTDEALSSQFATGTMVLRSHLTTRYTDRRFIRGEASLFRSTRQNECWIFERDDFPKEISIQDTASDFPGILYRDLPGLKQDCAEFAISQILRSMDGNSIGTVLGQVVQMRAYEVKYYRWDCYDFGLDDINKVVWLSGPSLEAEWSPIDMLVFIVWSRKLDIRLLQHSADSTQAIFDMAAVLHGINLDVWTNAALFSNECDDPKQDEIRGVTNEIFAAMMEAARQKKSKSEMYDLYARASVSFNNTHRSRR